MDSMDVRLMHVTEKKGACISKLLYINRQKLYLIMLMQFYYLFKCILLVYDEQYVIQLPNNHEHLFFLHLKQQKTVSVQQ